MEAAPLGRSSLPQVVESCLEGVCKPDPRIYQLCLQRLGLQPSEAIFLDDLGQNLKAAASLGIHTIKVILMCLLSQHKHDPVTFSSLCPQPFLVTPFKQCSSSNYEVCN